LARSRKRNLCGDPAGPSRARRFPQIHPRAGV
jgi:hypothetical protein